jgi:AraC family transcriptional regulator, regulatory protein of adaptative response / methylated-DNA-[protein]-cysteine methyltransferase
MTQQTALIPQSGYETIRAAIAYLSEVAPDELDLNRFARALGLSERQLTSQFRAWCGLTPKSFAQAVALDHAKALLRQKQSVLDTTYEVGLSSTSRLHDLFVAHEAMPPGVFRAKGEGIGMVWGAAPSPFGIAVITTTPYGISGIGFADSEDGVEAAFEDLAGRWPNAGFTRNDTEIAPLAARVFDPMNWDPERPVRVVLIGTDFEVKVWETLLRIPCGKATTYSDVANHIGRPTASRAVGAAVGKNPISFVVPCHRVVGSNGALTGYHWGLPRKRAILGWESGVAARS